MSIPLLEIAPTTQNQRVEGYDVLDEDDAKLYRLTDKSTDSDINDIIWAAYRQVFSEHLILDSYRQLFLESQLRNRAISVREFIRGLGKSDVYRELVGETNSNYRLVDITFKRLLGRSTYNKDEQIAWSIVIATKGLHGFIDAILESEEYLQNFGEEIVPYQRRRMNQRPFNLVNPRYGEFWRGRLIELEYKRYVQASVYGSGTAGKQYARQAIPSGFISMARTINLPTLNSQRDVDRSRNVATQGVIPDSTRPLDQAQATVKPTRVALPYRYLPSLPRG